MLDLAVPCKHKCAPSTKDITAGSCGRVARRRWWLEVSVTEARGLFLAEKVLAVLASLWSFRYFVIGSIRADFHGRFARSRLGFFWIILNPIIQSLIFAVVLAEVLGARLPQVEGKAAYPIYLLSGMAAWGLFSEILNRNVTIFIEQSAALKKIAFPRLCLPFIVWGTALVNHVVLLGAILLILLFIGHLPGAAALAIIPGILIISMLAFGIGVFLGILNVFARDVGQVVGVVLQFWFWMTPIVYTRNVVPEKFRIILEANPMTPLVGIYQDALLLNAWPSPAALVVPLAIGVAAMLLSFIIFRRASPDLVDAL